MSKRCKTPKGDGGARSHTTGLKHFSLCLPVANNLDGLSRCHTVTRRGRSTAPVRGDKCTRPGRDGAVGSTRTRGSYVLNKRLTAFDRLFEHCDAGFSEAPFEVMHPGCEAFYAYKYTHNVSCTLRTRYYGYMLRILNATRNSVRQHNSRRLSNCEVRNSTELTKVWRKLGLDNGNDWTVAPRSVLNEQGLSRSSNSLSRLIA